MPTCPRGPRRRCTRRMATNRPIRSGTSTCSRAPTSPPALRPARRCGQCVRHRRTARRAIAYERRPVRHRPSSAGGARRAGRGEARRRARERLLRRRRTHERRRISIRTRPKTIAREAARIATVKLDAGRHRPATCRSCRRRQRRGAAARGGRPRARKRFQPARDVAVQRPRRRTRRERSRHDLRRRRPAGRARYRRRRRRGNAGTAQGAGRERGLARLHAGPPQRAR